MDTLFIVKSKKNKNQTSKWKQMKKESIAICSNIKWEIFVGFFSWSQNLHCTPFFIAHYYYYELLLLVFILYSFFLSIFWILFRYNYPLAVSFLLICFLFWSFGQFATKVIRIDGISMSKGFFFLSLNE